MRSNIGRFYITYDDCRRKGYFNRVKKALKLRIIEVDNLDLVRQYCITGYSPHFFKEVPVTAPAPLYKITFHSVRRRFLWFEWTTIVPTFNLTGSG